jgi:hypothetical protein
MFIICLDQIFLYHFDVLSLKLSVSESFSLLLTQFLESDYVFSFTHNLNFHSIFIVSVHAKYEAMSIQEGYVVEFPSVLEIGNYSLRTALIDAQ